MTAHAKRRTDKHAANPLVLLHDHGQAVWLDFLRRSFIAKGDLETLIEQDGLTGVTSNPSIFEKAIGESNDYDASLEQAEAAGDLGIMTLYESVAIEDIRRTADILQPVCVSTNEVDGYVSLEVSPYLATNTDATIAEARRLWQAVGRDNVMIKVPATTAGLPAIRRLIGDGVNVNITLLFSRRVYEQVVEAYLAGLEDLAARGGDPGKVASVASFFVSRIDVAVDKLIEERLRQGGSDDERELLRGLRGKVAVANAKLAYQRYKHLFAGARWDRLRAKGARVQRLLWASTGTKSKAYSDVLYVEELIGADTVNTMPPATMNAFRDHGTARPSLEENVAGAEQIITTLDRLGISLDAVTGRLVEDGVRLFADAFDKLLGAVAGKRALILSDDLNQQEPRLPADLETAVQGTLETWRRDGNIRRLWAGDASLWSGTDESKWLGWLGIVEEQRDRIDALARLAREIRHQDFSHVLLLGMGGSSLGPEVLAEAFGPQPGHPRLLVLDSTDPAQIRTFEGLIDLARTLFIVSSKSGTTLEPDILHEYFFKRVEAVLGTGRAGARFMAVTDPGSQLQTVALRDQFRHVAFGKPSIGGRYSVLSDFGMVPAAAMGLDIRRLLRETLKMARACGADVPPAQNPGVELGIILGALASSGRDKVTVVASPGIADFGAWLEQLLAESTGKLGKGIIPVDCEPLGAPSVYAQDRLFVYLRLTSGADAGQDRATAALERAGHPTVRIAVTDRYHIGQEFFRWEIATAVAGALLGIDPFNQPDVEASKVRTRELTSAYASGGTPPPEHALLEQNGLSLFAGGGGGDSAALAALGTPEEALRAHLDRLQPGNYCAILAYIERNAPHCSDLQDIRRIIRDRKRVATCVGFGPRFLHSTGQAYKGGPDTGVFLQITCDDVRDIAIPGRPYGFGMVKSAQARGDFEVLAERGRRALRVHLGADVTGGLATLKQAIRHALT